MVSKNGIESDKEAMELEEAIYKISEVFGMLKFEAKILSINAATAKNGKTYYKVLVTPKGKEAEDPYLLFGWGESKIENINEGDVAEFTAEESNGFMNIHSALPIHDVNAEIEESDLPPALEDVGEKEEALVTPDLPRPPKKAIGGFARAGGAKTKSQKDDSWGGTDTQLRISAMKVAVDFNDTYELEDLVNVAKKIERYMKTGE